jgi:hypothetical protein
MLVAAFAVVSALGWPWKPALFPLAIGIPLFCLAAAEALWSLLRPGERVAAKDFQLSEGLPGAVARRRTAAAGAWIAAFFAAIVLLGFPLAVPLFVLLYLKLQGRESWLMSGAVTAAVWAVFYGLFDLLLHLPFPAGWIQEWLGLG